MCCCLFHYASLVTVCLVVNQIFLVFSVQLVQDHYAVHGQGQPLSQVFLMQEQARQVYQHQALSGEPDDIVKQIWP